MIRYEHIFAVGKVGSKEYVFDFLPNSFVSSARSERITDEQAFALYYSNRSVESLIDGDLERGIQLSLQALRLWPKNSNFWSNLGCAYRRDGKIGPAQYSFKRALLLDRQNYSALSNLTHFFIRQQRAQKRVSTLGGSSVTAAGILTTISF
ncbi:MAG: tetratricopeptide (TPR) repeat protein [Candidatus Azotimanducaceae bacterium]|jgi:tetratricopeptide (TPR) repeat protein